MFKTGTKPTLLSKFRVIGKDTNFTMSNFNLDRPTVVNTFYRFIHSTDNVYPTALYSENNWSNGTGTVIGGEAATAATNGYITNRVFNNFTFTTVLTIPLQLKDAGIVIGFYKDPITGKESTLSLIATYQKAFLGTVNGIVGFGLAIVQDLGQSTQKRIWSILLNYTKSTSFGWDFLVGTYSNVKIRLYIKRTLLNGTASYNVSYNTFFNATESTNAFGSGNFTFNNTAIIASSTLPSYFNSPTRLGFVISGLPTTGGAANCAFSDTKLALDAANIYAVQKDGSRLTAGINIVDLGSSSASVFPTGSYPFEIGTILLCEEDGNLYIVNSDYSLTCMN